jgi:hypothetical protein
LSTATHEEKYINGYQTTVIWKLENNNFHVFLFHLEYSLKHMQETKKASPEQFKKGTNLNTVRNTQDNPAKK